MAEDRRFEEALARLRTALAEGALPAHRVGLARASLESAARVDADDVAEREGYVELVDRLLAPVVAAPPTIAPELAGLLDGLRARGRRPLVVAARDGDVPGVRGHLGDADPETRALAMEEAARHGHGDVVRALLAEGVPVPGAALQEAVRRRDPEIVELLLGAHPGVEALEAACATATIEDDVPAVERLLAAGLPLESAKVCARRMGSKGMRGRLKKWR